MLPYKKLSSGFGQLRIDVEEADAEDGEADKPFSKEFLPAKRGQG